MRIVGLAPACLILLALSGATARAQTDCPAAFKPEYQEQYGLTRKFWLDRCTAGLTPEQILAEARRPAVAARRQPAAQRGPRAQDQQTKLGQALATSDFGGFYDGARLGADKASAVAAGGGGSRPGMVRPPPKAAPRLAPPALEANIGYHGPDTSKPWWPKAVWWNLKDMWNFYNHKMSPQEQAKLGEVKTLLGSTPSGRELIDSMGGWKTIERTVDIRFSPVANPRELGGTFPRLRAQGQGAAPALGVVLSDRLLKEPAELIATVLGHELSHARDFQANGMADGLALPSEFQAHRTEVYIYEDLVAKSSPQRLAELEKSGSWVYTRFVAELWRDQILKRYPTMKDFQRQFQTGALPHMAQQAYQDLADGTIGPGSVQLDYHVEDLYRVATSESDVKDQRGADPAVLSKRRKLVELMDTRDRDYRHAHGFDIPAGVR